MSIGAIAVAAVLLLTASAVGSAPAMAQSRSQATQADSENAARRREELRDAIARFGYGTRGTLTPLARLGYALLDDRRYDESERVFRRQLEVAEALFPGASLQVGHGFQNLGEMYRRSRRCAEAVPLYQRAVEIRMTLPETERPDLARSYNRLGICQVILNRFVEAEVSHKASLATAEQAFGDDSPEVASAANDLGELYLRTGRYPAAVEVLGRVVAIREARFGRDDQRLLLPLSRLGYGLLDSARPDEAEKVFRRQLALAEQNFPGETVEVSFPLHHLGEAFRHLGRCDEAESYYRRALSMREKLGLARDDLYGRTLLGQARCHVAQGRFAAAEEAFSRAVAAVEAAHGPDSADVATALLSKGEFYVTAFRFQDAEPVLLRALAIRETIFGLEDFRIPAVLNGLARTYRWTERYPLAEQSATRGLAIREKLFGPDHEFTAASVGELGILYTIMGRFAESEQLNRRAVAIYERVLGPEHRRTGDALASLAETYFSQGRNSEAVDMFRRSIQIQEKALGPAHPFLVFPLRMLGQSLRRLGRNDDAVTALSRGLAIAETSYGSDNRRVAQVAARLARSLMDIGRLPEAERLMRRAIAIHEASVGPDSVAVAYDLLDLARLKLRLRQNQEAERLAARGLGNLARLRGADDFEVAWARVLLASAMEAQDRLEPALDELRQATKSFRTQMDRAKDERSGAGLAEQANYRSAFMDHVFLLWRAQNAGSVQRRTLTAEAFEVVQLAQATGTEAAVARMAARFASGTNRLAELVRAREDALERWRTKDATLVQFLGRTREERDLRREAALRDELQQLDADLKELDARIARDFPEYASLALPHPASLSEIQALLGHDEAMVLWLVGARRTLIMAVRRDSSMFVRVDIGRQALNDAIRELRQGLDPSNVTSLQDIPRFDTTRAHQLYRAIFAPIETLLSGARTVFVVPEAGLQSLPLGVLVSKAPQTPINDFSGYRQTEWLAKRYATTVLPSVSTLKSLRRFARTAQASEPFLGVGDPQLEGPPGSSRGINMVALFARGAIADTSEIRRLPPLPETADELRAMAATLKAGERSLYLGERATERLVRQMDLQKYRVLAFATHGLMAGEFSEVGEPALVMTPPATGSLEDDGVLTASEIANLRLDADWVILSACNTAAADGTPGAEGLSGLARAFFYAGSRALLVSHWAVLSEATVKLTTTMLGEMAKDASLGRAEAHRRAMLALAADRDIEYYAHPMFWAPFVVVGEGRAALRQ